MNNLQQETDVTSESPLGSPDDIDVLDILIIFARRRRLIGFATLSGLIAGAVLSFLLKPNFTATATILPPQQQPSTASIMNQLGSLAALGGGGASALGLKNPADMYIGILQSRTIADDIISQFQLGETYHRKRLLDTRAQLKACTEIQAGKDSLIHISVTDHDANRASDLANAYVNELYRVNSHLAISEAAQRRVFFDQQMEGEKKALVAAEEDLRDTQKRTGIIQLSGQAQVIIQTIAQLRALIASREVELQSARTFATAENPEIARMSEGISTMRQQLAKLENDQARESRPGNLAVPAGRIPEDSLEYERRLREVKYHDTLLDLLSRQYEAARIDEAKSAPIIQIIDRAVPPDRKSGPHRSLITGGLAMLGFLLASVWVILTHGLRSMRRIPENSQKFQQLSLLMRMKRS